MAANTKRPEVGVVERHRRISPVVWRQPDHMMDVLGRRVDPALQTVLAKRMQLEVSPAASLPGRTVVKRFRCGSCHHGRPAKMPGSFLVSAAGHAPSVPAHKKQNKKIIKTKAP